MKQYWYDIIWVSCILAANVVFFVRKIILARHGYGFSMLDTEMRDGDRLRSVMARMPEGRGRTLLLVLNRSFGLLFLAGVVIALAVRAIPALVGKWS